MTMFTRKYNECRSVFISFNQGACLRISGFRVRLATDGYEVIVSDHGSKVIQIDPFVCQANGPHSADRVCMITGPPVPVLGNGPTANAGPIPPPIPQMMYFPNPGAPAYAPAPAAPAPAPTPAVPGFDFPAPAANAGPIPPPIPQMMYFPNPGAPAPAPIPAAPAPAVPGFDLPAPAPANGPSTPTNAELRERRMAALAFSSSEKEGASTGTKRSHDTAFSGSQDSLSSIESVDSLSQLLSSRSDLTVLLNMLVQQELAKKIATVEDDNGPAKRTKM